WYQSFHTINDTIKCSWLERYRLRPVKAGIERKPLNCRYKKESPGLSEYRRYLFWRRWRDSNPRCGYKPHAPLAGEYLQPLGHISVKADILAQGWPGSSAFDDMNSAVFRNESILIKLEGPVQRTDSQFHVFVFDHHRCLDLAGADHLDVDALFCQGAEHQAGNTHVTAHANAHNGHLAHLGVGDDFAGADRG